MPFDRPQPTGALAPTSGQEREEFLDILRGFALVGIVLANMISYSLYLYLSEPAKASVATATTDKALAQGGPAGEAFLELVLIEGKFYTIFSVLFGIGFSILMTRSQAKGLVFHRFFLRRALFLFLIGLGHAVLFWHHDILAAYAVCGALLLPLRNAGNRIILAASLLALGAPVAMKALGWLPSGSLHGLKDLLFEAWGFTAAGRVAVWTTGSLTDILLLNFASLFSQVGSLLTSGMLFRVYGLFLLGFYLGRNGIHKDLPRYAPVVRRIAVLGLAIGLPLNVLYARTFGADDLAHVVIATVAVLPLSAGYACLLALLWMGPKRRLLQLFSPVGRMALTNYVGQSVIAALLFRGIGLGLGGAVGPTLYLPIGLAVYVLQVALSRAWLARFQFGPLEWLWRMLTYGSWVPLAKRPAVSGTQA